MTLRVKLSLAIYASVAVLTSGCSTSRAIGGDPRLSVTPSGEMPAPNLTDLVRQDGTYTVGPYDKLTISVYGMPELSAKEILVDANGSISFPLVGPVNVLSMNAGQIEKLIAIRLQESFIRDPQVTVNLLESVSHAITIDGQVKRPGQYPIAGGMTLLRSLSLAEGATDNAKLSDVVVFRTVSGKRYAALYDLGAIRRGRYGDPDVYANDIVMVGDAASRRLFKDVLTAVPGILAPVVILLTQ
jgi:polysaccharide export outer membrane protein